VFTYIEFRFELGWELPETPQRYGRVGISFIIISLIWGVIPIWMVPTEVFVRKEDW
jgi:hypothetical protein